MTVFRINAKVKGMTISTTYTTETKEGAIAEMLADYSDDYGCSKDEIEILSCEPNVMKVIHMTSADGVDVIEIDGSLEAMQKLVGGLIESYPLELDDLDGLCVIYNDESKILGLPATMCVFGKNGEPIEVICGDCFICKYGYDDFVGLTDKEILTFLEHTGIGLAMN